MLSIHATLVALIASVIAVRAAPSLTVKTSIPNVEVDGLENLRVTVTILNTGDETLKLLNDPRGILSSFPENSFIITNAAGFRPSFNGAKVTYSPAYATGLNCSNAFTVLAPGSSINVIHDLSAAYNFTPSGAGDYSIEPSNLFTYVDTDGTPKNLYATVKDVAEVKLSGNLAVSRAHDKRASSSYPGCSPRDLMVLVAAATRAQEYANEAYSYVRYLRDTTPRYYSWFGGYTDDRKWTVQYRFRRIKDHGFMGIMYNCNCPHPELPTWAAYVYAEQYGTIYICPPFWGLPETGADSKAGTLIHESSHFFVNGHTYDLVYGRRNAVDLSKRDPDDAVINADNYQGLSEDLQNTWSLQNVIGIPTTSFELRMKPLTYQRHDPMG